jgi:hypothetical protein
MADRIFPNTYQEEPLDSDLVYKGIDWDNFNQKLAEVKNAPAQELPEEFRQILAKKSKDDDSEDMPEEVEKMFKEKEDRERDEEDAEDLSDVPEQLREHVKKKQDKKKKDHDDEEDHDDEKDSMKHDKGHMKKKASPIVFNHPSQLSAEAVEAAIEAGDDNLKNAILAARHERRVRLASKIEEQIEAENEVQTKLAQRRAYRESLVQKVASSEKQVKTASQKAEDFVKVSEATNKSKKAFAAKALSQGFPQEYVDAILGNNETVDNTVEIREVMASNLPSTTMRTVVSNMVKEATLTDADYSRLIRYWKEELGYGDQEWIDALFTKKYD